MGQLSFKKVHLKATTHRFGDEGLRELYIVSGKTEMVLEDTIMICRKNTTRFIIIIEHHAAAAGDLEGREVSRSVQDCNWYN